MNTLENLVETERGIYTIRPYEASDLPAVLSAWQAAFRRPITKALWHWKYHEAPHGHQIILCEHDSGEVAALYGGLRYAAAWRGRKFAITQMVDVFSHPRHRKVLGGTGGLYAATAQRFFSRFTGPSQTLLMYGLPGQRAFRHGKHRLNYVRLPGGMHYLTVSVQRLLESPRRRSLAKLDRIDLETLSGADRLAQSVPDDRLQAIRDGAFLRWRFFQHPERSYRLFRYRSAFRGTWLGYAATAVAPPVATLVDLSLPQEAPAAGDLLRRLAGVLAACGIDMLQTWLPANGPDASRLMTLGFRAEPEPLGIVPTTRPFAPAALWAEATNALHYTMADSDLM